MKTLLKLLEQNANKISISSTGAGLFANLAVFDLIGESLVAISSESAHIIDKTLINFR